MERDQVGEVGSKPAIDEDELARSVEEAIRLADGDVRSALAASLIANAYLEAEVERLAAAVARGYVRGRVRTGAESPAPVVSRIVGKQEDR
ncbi:hypothetical protein GCM10007874_44150 [Labrys miyagiensis]|uniref:Uncharacterized protein n=1 Tax=Labrys miyagiensis TaxID=346912 RepID=A0ABQ6CNR3_9HYPH|nr:hypothetical protein [Labrys miyagiensis]GLS21398.1 hypothetical protein GCM10007874_44150 [Labrys miyagiensis]